MPRQFLKRSSKRRYLKKRPIARLVKNIVNRKVETKLFQEIYGSSTLSAASPVIVPISNVAEGDTGNDRTGRVIEPVRLQCKVVVKANAAVPISAVRMTIVKFKQCQGTLPTLADIFPSSAVTIGNISHEMPLLSTQIANDKRKFQIIYDKVKFISKGTDDANRDVLQFYVSKRLKGKTYYTGVNGTDEGSNQYYLMLHTDNTDNDMVRLFTKRFYFKDA